MQHNSVSLNVTGMVAHVSSPYLAAVGNTMSFFFSKSNISVTVQVIRCVGNCPENTVYGIFLQILKYKVKFLDNRWLLSS